MSPAAEAVWQQLAALPAADREAIADRLAGEGVDHLPGEDGLTPEAWRAAWHAEVVARLGQIDRGEVTLLTLDEAQARMRRAAEDVGA